jgi:hypothetical protein
MIASALLAASLLASAAPAAPGADSEEELDLKPFAAITSATVGAAIGYGVGAAAVLFVTNGANPINALLYHPGESTLQMVGLVTPALTAAFGAALSMFFLEPIWAASAALLAGASVLLAHSALLLASEAGVDYPIELELPMLVTALVTGAAVAGTVAVFGIAADEME